VVGSRHRAFGFAICVASGDVLSSIELALASSQPELDL